jgi:uncharacterized protein YceH (UPF0502 family)
VDIILNEIEIRVLGALVEKETATPDYYPLSLNALMNACNQKSNRHPVMNLDEEAVRQALDGLNAKGLAAAASAADSRVTKYEHRLQEVFNFSRPEIAVLCVLLLRGAQTPGELRGRTERLHRFHDLDEVHLALEHLMKRKKPVTPTCFQATSKLGSRRRPRHPAALSRPTPNASPAWKPRLRHSRTRSPT